MKILPLLVPVLQGQSLMSSPGFINVLWLSCVAWSVIAPCVLFLGCNKIVYIFQLYCLVPWMMQLCISFLCDVRDLCSPSRNLVGFFMLGLLMDCFKGCGYILNVRSYGKLFTAAAFPISNRVFLVGGHARISKCVL